MRVYRGAKHKQTTWYIDGSLQHHATVSLVALGSTEEGSPRGVLEYLAHPFARSRRALQIVLSPNLVRHSHTLDTRPDHSHPAERGKESKTEKGVPLLG